MKFKRDERVGTRCSCAEKSTGVLGNLIGNSVMVRINVR